MLESLQLCLEDIHISLLPAMCIEISEWSSQNFSDLMPFGLRSLELMPICMDHNSFSEVMPTGMGSGWPSLFLLIWVRSIWRYFFCGKIVCGVMRCSKTSMFCAFHAGRSELRSGSIFCWWFVLVICWRNLQSHAGDRKIHQHRDAKCRSIPESDWADKRTAMWNRRALKRWSYWPVRRLGEIHQRRLSTRIQEALSGFEHCHGKEEDGGWGWWYVINKPGENTACAGWRLVHIQWPIKFAPKFQTLNRARSVK